MKNLIRLILIVPALVVCGSALADAGVHQPIVVERTVATQIGQSFDPIDTIYVRHLHADEVIGHASDLSFGDLAGGFIGTIFGAIGMMFFFVFTDAFRARRKAIRVREWRRDRAQAASPYRGADGV
jgi:hypothetical protein